MRIQEISEHFIRFVIHEEEFDINAFKSKKELRDFKREINQFVKDNEKPSQT